MKPLSKTEQNHNPSVGLFKTAIFFSICVLICSSVSAGEKPEKNNNPAWNLVENDSEITLFDRWLEMPDGRKTRERKGVFYVGNSVEEITEMVSSPEGIQRWMAGVEESRKVTDNIIYLLFNVPWPFKNKDLVAQISSTLSPDGQEKKLHYSAVANYLPAANNAERLQSYEATWTITKAVPGRTQVIFTAYSNTPPIAPRWIQDPITAKLFKDNLLKLREILIELDYNNLNALKQ
jgi:hypothetical protein